MRALALVGILLLAACGDKVPQSEAAKKIGDIPKQTIDSAKSGVSKAMEVAPQRLEEKKE